jgi:hypothetical protein
VSAATCDTLVDVEQKFNINFQAVGAQVFNKSGNPGYLQGFPLLAGKANPAGGIDTKIQGFLLRGADLNGLCTAGDVNKFFALSYPRVNFAENSVFPCRLSMDKAALKTYCTTKEWLNKDIFKQLDDFKQVG